MSDPRPAASSPPAATPPTAGATPPAGPAAPGDGAPAHRPPAGAEIQAVWPGPAGPLDYRARAGWTVLHKDEKPAAEIFSVSYLQEPRDGGEAAEQRRRRPVTFVFNGGPGASSAYLQMGALGPTRVAFPPDGRLPAMPPRLVDNDESWLAFTDLVFIDPIGTGFSRVIPVGADAAKDGEKAEDPDVYFGYKRDLESLCEFIGRWLSAQRRWGAPVFIAGESYGGYRVGRLVRMLQESAGVGLCGALLISPALEIAGLDPNDYEVLAWVDALPTMALAAVHHGRCRVFSAGTPTDTVIAAATEFATGEYATLLIRGAGMPREERDRILTRAADLIGLDVSLLTRAEGRIGIETFVRELLRDEHRTVGLYDATITGPDPFPDRSRFEGPDPTLAGATPVYMAAINAQLRRVIGVETEREYHLLSYDVNAKWKNDAPEHFFSPPRGATDDLRYGMALNPHLRTLICHGRYDLVTPFASSDRLAGLMRLDPATAARLSVQHFDGGHMFYAWEASRRAFTATVADFYAAAQPEG
jgi:carboxypeptidase C (cathepsin A)